jgi:hypothetical protein
MFRKAVQTLAGVKAGSLRPSMVATQRVDEKLISDAVFSYQLPFNLVAVVLMWPMSYILSPRW